MKKINVAVIGVGRMGSVHARNLLRGKVKGAKLFAVCDIKQSALDSFTKKYGKVATFLDYKSMLKEEKIDAVVIATEHYYHPDIAVYCIENGVNVLVEKPLAVTTFDAKRVIKCANDNQGVITAVMYNQRTNPLFYKAKELISNDVIGKVQRINYIVTDWYRSQAYYNQGGWRASLWGEGGGTLINQCIHQLDLLQWITGMPDKVNVKMFTKNRKITVENDVTALFEYKDDVYCSFSASTHELRGTNRLEISGDKGRIVIDKLRMKVFTYKNSEVEVNEKTKYGYGIVTRKVKKYSYVLGFAKALIYGQQRYIVQNFVNSINFGEKLISPLKDGINAVELINGMYLSSWENRTVDLPIDDEYYKNMLLQKIIEEKKLLNK
jgi:predicted dehydrogenase